VLRSGWNHRSAAQQLLKVLHAALVYSTSTSTCPKTPKTT
jgi:hypothetical protein